MRKKKTWLVTQYLDYFKINNFFFAVCIHMLCCVMFCQVIEARLAHLPWLKVGPTPSRLFCHPTCCLNTPCTPLIFIPFPPPSPTVSHTLSYHLTILLRVQMGMHLNRTQTSTAWQVSPTLHNSCNGHRKMLL